MRSKSFGERIADVGLRLKPMLVIVSNEHVRTIGCEVGGAKRKAQGEHARAAHTPDTEPGERVTGASACIGQGCSE